MKRWRRVLIVAAALLQVIPVLLLPPELPLILVIISVLLDWALLALRPVAGTLTMVTLFSVDRPKWHRSLKCAWQALLLNERSQSNTLWSSGRRGRRWTQPTQ